MSEPIVIIGAGQAAIKATETLRGAGYDGVIVLIGKETAPPYQRPPLSKAYLAGAIDASRLFFKLERFYADNNVDFRPGLRASAIAPAERKVSLADGTRLPYSNLLIATGARARVLALPGCDLNGVVTLRSIADVDAIRARLESVETLAVIGGGYIGLEVAAVVRKSGRNVTVLEGRERVMARVVSPQVSDFFEKLHRDNGVDLRMNVAIERLVGDTDVKAVALADGSTLPADMVLVAVGAQPNSELAEQAGLPVQDGIKVDRFARTAAPNIFAAGDCTRFPSRRYGRELRLESVQNAIDQAKTAASAMLGDAQAYDPVPWFWSDQYDVKLQIAGLSDGYDRTTIEQAPGNGFAVSYFKGERLLAVDAVNAPRAHMLSRRALAGEAVPA
jgi:3-phenylpropionate/trans-cinnamate dioxygenase ferredoxin reductase subunit